MFLVKTIKDLHDRSGFPNNPRLCLVIERSVQTTSIQINFPDLQVSLHACYLTPFCKVVCYVAENTISISQQQMRCQLKKAAQARLFRGLSGFAIALPDLRHDLKEGIKFRQSVAYDLHNCPYGSSVGLHYNISSDFSINQLKLKSKSLLMSKHKAMYQKYAVLIVEIALNLRFTSGDKGNSNP